MALDRAYTNQPDPRTGKQKLSPHLLGAQWIDSSVIILTPAYLDLYTHGSVYRKNGISYAGETICNDFQIAKSAILPPSSSAQVADLYAWMRA